MAKGELQTQAGRPHMLGNSKGSNSILVVVEGTAEPALTIQGTYKWKKCEGNTKGTFQLTVTLDI
jgi:hypothetical protein